jgi:UDP-N-acetylmuramoylalanine--D-glutamate ligase
MVDFKSHFKGKKITVMGLGLLGRGVGDVAFLAGCGAELTVTDLKPATALSSSLAKLRKFKNIKYQADIDISVNKFIVINTNYSILDLI